MKKAMLKVVVTSNNEIIGSMTPKAFMDYCGKSGFLQALVKEFNEMKEAIGEPERVYVSLAK